VPVIATAELTKTFPRVTALDRLTITVGDGVTGLVGANGAGKSTLIKILLGLLPGTSGCARVLDRDVVAEGEAIRAEVGYMPEHDCLPPDVSASELVMHLGQMSGLPTTAARERAADVLRHVGLAEERYRPIGGYSTGMRQRVKLAQALVHDPALVLLDEPTNGLDPAARDDMLELIRRIGTEFGIAVLVTSHLLGELERISDHVVILDAGRLLRSSATAEFTQTTGVLHVEVLDADGVRSAAADGTGAPGNAGAADAPARDRLGHALARAGLRVRPDGRGLAVAAAGDGVYDLIRDTTVDLGLGLVRLEQGRHRIEEVFRDDDGGDDGGPA
jgi:ABC-2 type transport system ATP-binding protein